VEGRQSERLNTFQLTNSDRNSSRRTIEFALADIRTNVDVVILEDCGSFGAESGRAPRTAECDVPLQHWQWDVSNCSNK